MYGLLLRLLEFWTVAQRYKRLDRVMAATKSRLRSPGLRLWRP